jgi:Asp-tRNA(Asn)/Glu-tRNA(Gln) amidotransferase A subunit family amidase
MSYHREDVKTPRVAGLALRAFVSALESAVGPVLLDKLVKDSGLDLFRKASPGDAPPMQHPLPHPSGPAQIPSQYEQAAKAIANSKVGKLETVARYAETYRGGGDPAQVMRKLSGEIERLDGRDERLNIFISRKPDEVLAAADASAQRIRAGKPLSVLDGVPVVLKDEVDAAGYVTTLGTRFRKEVATKDATVTARLKAAGAIILGKANMNEIGISPIGLNPWHGPARNPWNRHHISGGSSSASGSVVAAGLSPLAIGADGGGSIRIPAALCGIVGLKATWGRIPETGVPPLCWNVGHVGPMGLTVDDVAAMYAVIAGADDHDLVSKLQPTAHLTDYENADLTGIRLGICWKWFEDAAPDIVEKCRAAVKVLTDAGAKVVEIEGPDLNTVLWTHSTIILTEMSTAMMGQIKKDVTQFGLDSRTNLAIGQHFRATDYVHALQHRHAMTRDWLATMKTCDVVVTPSTAITAPPIPESTLPEGESNIPVLDSLMRFIRIANLTGFPAISVNCGFDRDALPIGVHFMGRPYEEHLLLRLARVVEQHTEVRTPPEHASALK